MSELKQHEEEFAALIRAILADVVRAKLGVLSGRANDALHKLDHLERLRKEFS